jgi:NADH:ubiquinone oxidoreductase subunit 2 (subunit N)
MPTLNYKAIFFAVDFANIQSFNKIGLLSNFEHPMSLILIGFLVKLGAAPFHIWVPDVYAGSHTIVTAFFSTIVKFILFMFFIKFYIFFNNNLIINIAATFSLILGTILTLRQLEIKRFIAYSSITHLGFLLICDFYSSYIYILTYIISLLLFFCVLLNIKLYGHELIYFNDLRLLKKTGQLNNLFLIVSTLSMAGIPPLSGFFGKFLV